MKQINLISFLLFSLLKSSAVVGQVYLDAASNYAGSWTNGSNQGTGFGAWQITNVGSTGYFIGNPSNDGMQTTGIGTTAFGMYATSSTNYVSAYRPFTQAMAIGDVFSFYWAINWDANTGNKGFDIKSGTTTVFNVNNTNDAQINSTNGVLSTAFGVTPMLVTVIRLNTTQYLIKVSRRVEEGGDYSTVFSSTNPVNGVYFYMGAQGATEKERNMYFNQLRIEKGAYTEPVPNFVIYKWSGALTPVSIKVNAKLAYATDAARLVVSTSNTLNNPVYSTPVAVSSATNFVGSFTVNGLTPDTEYFYSVESNGITDQSPEAIGRFRTAKSGPHSFSFTAGACNLNSRNPVWKRIREKDPLFMLAQGDLHYSDPNSTNVNVHRIPYEDRILSIENTRLLFGNYPLAYVWDDHDFSGDNSNAASTGAASAKQAYREYVPHYPFGSGLSGVNSPIYQSFVIGRVRFILSDLRSERTTEFIMSPQQLDWFKNQCLEAKSQNQMICWVSSFGITANNVDAWGGTPMAMAQRNEIFSFLVSQGIENLFVVSGDAHAAGIDDGDNTDCSGVLDTHTCPRYTCSINPRYPLLHAAGLSNTVSLKGVVTNILPMTGQNHNGQYAKVDVVDTGGDSIKVNFTVYRVNPDTGGETVLGTYSFSRKLQASAKQKTLTTTGDDWKYLDNGTNQGTSWTNSSFNDGSWLQGASPFGYGATGVRTTVGFGNDAANKYITTYFRKTINIANACFVKAAYLELSVDDGAVVYLNNKEVGRANFDQASHNYLTTATTVVTNVPQTFRFCITDPTLFKTGDNTISVEVHQHSGASSDLFFNLNFSVVEDSEPIRSRVVQTACNSYTWNGQTYNQSGTYQFSTVTGTGCDSIASLQLTINKVEISQQPVDVTSDINTAAGFTIASSNGGATYQWQLFNGLTFENLSNTGQYSGVTTANLVITSLNSLNNNQQYRCVVYASGCSTISDVVTLKVNVPTGLIDPTGLNGVWIYPNPATDQLQVQVGTKLIGAPFVILDFSGRQVSSGILTTSGMTIPVAKLGKGIYMLKVGYQKQHLYRFVKQ